MQVREHEEEKFQARNLDGLFNPEGRVFPRLMKPGLGRICEYCVIKSGYPASFPALIRYLKHVLFNHDGYSVYAVPEDLERFRKSLPLANDYQKKLKQRCKYDLNYAKQGTT